MEGSAVRSKSGVSGPLVVGIISLLVLLLVLYVLSCGPALWLHWRGYLPAKFLAIYAPLQWAAEFCDPFSDFLTWYKNHFRPEPALIW